MPEKLQILYMQTRLVRLASEKWQIPIEKINTFFQNNGIYHYIAEFWGLFHIESDEAVLEEIENHLSSKGVKIWSEN